MITTAPRPDVVSAPWGEGALLLDLQERRIHELNGPATAVWDALATVGPDEVVDLLADRYAAPRDQLRRDVAGAVEAFDTVGLLVAGPSEGHRPPAGGVAALPPPAEPPVGAFRAGEWCFSLWCAHEEMAAEADRILRPLRIPEATAQPSPGRLEIVAHDTGRFSVRCDGEPVVDGATPGSAIDLLVATVNARAVSESPYLVGLHAGAVGMAGGAVVFPGVSNSGKSTLVTALWERGAVYLSDEVALLDPSTGAVLAYPKSISLDPGSFALFPSLHPPAGPLFADHRARKWHVDTGAEPDEAPWPLQVVVAPTYREGAVTNLESVPARQAVDLLLANSFDFAAAGAEGFAALVRIAREVPVRRLTVGDLETAVGLVDQLARR